jgi:hypothetical protein
MSTFTECIGCLQQPLKWEQLAAFVIVEDTDGTKYWNVQLNERGSCSEYSPGVNCISPQSLIELFASTIVEDECGLCAINILGNCDNA